MGTEHEPPRARWNDQAIDRLADLVDDHTNELGVIRAAVNNIGRIETALSSLLENARDEKLTGRKFRTETRRALADLTPPAPQPKSWTSIVVAVIGLLGIVIAALIAAYAAVHTGGRP